MGVSLAVAFALGLVAHSVAIFLIVIIGGAVATVAMTLCDALVERRRNQH